MASSLGLCAAMCAPFALGASAHSKPIAPKHVTCTLISEYAAATPGSTITLGVDLAIEKKWHIYSNSRNDSGFAPKAEWQLPAGFTIDALQWPAPVRHVDPGDLLNHVYFDHVTLPVILNIPSSAEPGSTAVIKAKVSWLVCAESCVGEDAEVEIKLPIAKPADKPAKSPDAKKIDTANARLPRKITDQKIAVDWRGKSVTITAAGATHVEFFPDEDCIPLISPIKDPVADGPRLTISLDDPEPEQTSFKGVLEVQRSAEGVTKSTEWFRVEGRRLTPKPKSEPASAPAPSTPDKKAP